MKIIKLNPLHSGQRPLREVLEKERGYGLVMVQIDDLLFGLPLRSHLKHKHGFATLDGKGLDYSKAVLVDASQQYETFMIPREEHKILNDSEHKIRKQFEKYVANYKRLLRNNDQRAIENDYKFSTLINYHSELGVLR